MTPDDRRPHGPTGPEDHLADDRDTGGRLRTALHAEANRITPSNRLDAILQASREGVSLTGQHATPARRWVGPASAAAAAVVIGGSLLIANRPSGVTPPVAGTTTATSSSASSSTPPLISGGTPATSGSSSLVTATTPSQTATTRPLGPSPSAPPTRTAAPPAPAPSTAPPMTSTAPTTSTAPETRPAPPVSSTAPPAPSSVPSVPSSIPSASSAAPRPPSATPPAPSTAPPAPSAPPVPSSAPPAPTTNAPVAPPAPIPTSPNPTTQIPTAPTPSPTSPPGVPPTTTAPPVIVRASLPVYFAGPILSTGGRLVLFREFVGASVIADDGSKALAALSFAMDAPPASSTYRSLWQGVTPLAVTVESNRITVRLSRGLTGVDSERARIAVQQLVWTATAAVGKGALPVWFELGDGGSEVTPGLPTSRAYLRPADPTEAYSLLSPLWITTPVRGQSVAAGTNLTVVGVASTFEASLQWQLLRGGAEVASGFTTASRSAPFPGDYSFPTGPLVSGEYVIRVLNRSARDGSVDAEHAVPFSVR